MYYLVREWLNEHIIWISFEDEQWQFEQFQTNNKEMLKAIRCTEIGI